MKIVDLSLAEKHLALIIEVHNDHLEAGAVVGAHDFVHTLMVAQYALACARGEKLEPRMCELAWFSGLFHNADRLKKHKEKQYLNRWIKFAKLTENEENIVKFAVINHTQKNISIQNRIWECLTDGDKLANIGTALIIRSGQHYANIPAFDPHFVSVSRIDPTSSYLNPRSVWEDIRSSLEWRDKGWLHTKTAKKLATPRFALLETALKDVKNQLEETGLWPWPSGLPCP